MNIELEHKILQPSWEHHFIHVNDKMGFQMNFLIESSAANLADKWLFSRMHVTVCFQLSRRREDFATVTTDILFP